MSNIVDFRSEAAEGIQRQYASHEYPQLARSWKLLQSSVWRLGFPRYQGPYSYYFMPAVRPVMHIDATYGDGLVEVSGILREGDDVGVAAVQQFYRIKAADVTALSGTNELLRGYVDDVTIGYRMHVTPLNRRHRSYEVAVRLPDPVRDLDEICSEIGFDGIGATKYYYAGEAAAALAVSTQVVANLQGGVDSPPPPTGPGLAVVLPFRRGG